MKYVFIAKNRIGKVLAWKSTGLSFIDADEERKIECNFHFDCKTDLTYEVTFFSNRETIYLHILCKDILYHRSVHWLVGMGWGIWGESVVNRHEQFFYKRNLKEYAKPWTGRMWIPTITLFNQGTPLIWWKAVSYKLVWMDAQCWLSPFSTMGQGKGDINIVGFHAVSFVWLASHHIRGYIIIVLEKNVTSTFNILNFLNSTATHSKIML